MSKEPLGPLVRHGDDQWADIARWVLNALIIAEELGVTQGNVEGSYGEMLGLDADWAVHAIAAEGNYAEIFRPLHRPDTRLGLQRGLNALNKDGGILYAPPFR